jgi:hypothetical protein
MRLSGLRKKRRTGRLSFRANEEEVRRRLAAGATMILVYTELRERLGMSYSQFARYAGPLLKAQHTRSAVARKASASTGNGKPPPARAGPGNHTGPPRGQPQAKVANLDHFATDALNNDDLI